MELCDCGHPQEMHEMSGCVYSSCICGKFHYSIRVNAEFLRQKDKALAIIRELIQKVSMDVAVWPESEWTSLGDSWDLELFTEENGSRGATLYPVFDKNTSLEFSEELDAQGGIITAYHGRDPVEYFLGTPEWVEERVQKYLESYPVQGYGTTIDSDSTQNGVRTVKVYRYHSSD